MVEALTAGAGRTVALETPVFKAAVALPESVAVGAVDDFAGLLPGWTGSPPVISPPARRSLAALAGSRRRDATAVFYGAEEILDFEAGDTTGTAAGLAVDLGTTTIAAFLVDLVSGRTLATAAAVNGQVRFGSDVVSRITAAFGNPAAAEELRRAAAETINELIDSLLRDSGLGAASIYETVVAGNTAMSHLFLGRSVDSLAVAPFESQFTSIPALPASATGLNVNPAGRVYLAPIIRSFVGGDIAAGLSAVDIEKSPALTLFVDLGTNGEIVLKSGGRYLTTSTAAGPAFEGMNLSCGMIAAPGAISQAAWDRDWRLKTMGGVPARGVCGSGVIDILAEALDAGFMTPAGAVASVGKTIGLTPDIALLQRDVREIQLAAAAVKTGIRRLLSAAGAAASKLDRIYVAGAFGNTLNIRNAMKLGLVPSCAEDRIVFVGNSSLSGARILLLSSPERKRCEELARRIDHVALGQDEEFQNTFVEALEFSPWK